MKHVSLFDLLSSLDIESHDINLLANLYWNQQAAVRHNGEASESMNIKQGIRQGCVASPHLFALYTEMIMRNIEGKGGFRVGGTVVNNVRHADDTVIIAETEDIVAREGENKGLYLNGSNSFTMVFSKSTVIPTCNMTIHGTSLEQVNSFVYLGSMFTSDSICVQDVRRRIGIAKSAFT